MGMDDAMDDMKDGMESMKDKLGDMALELSVSHEAGRQRPHQMS